MERLVITRPPRSDGQGAVSAARDTIQSHLSRVEFTMMISMTMAVTALAIDMMLPAFGAMRSEFGLAADSNAVAPIVTSFFLGLAIGQPIFGPLSDALGRKRVLYIGLTIYILASIGAAFSPSLTVLLALRFVGGVGAAAPSVVSRSIVRDAYEGQAMAKAMSYVMAVFILVPVLAPTLGAIILTVGTWHMIFWFFAAFGIGVGLWTRRMPETLPPERRIPLNLSHLIGATGVVFRSRFAMGLTFAMTALFAFFTSYLASSQLIVDDIFGLDPWFPTIFGGSAAVLGVGMLVNARLLDIVDLRSLLRGTFVGYGASVVVFATIAWTTGGEPPFWLFLVGLTPILFCHALLIPNLNAAAMIPMGNVAGTAAAVTGTITILGGATVGAIIDRAYNGTIIPLATAGLIGCAVAIAFFVWAERTWDDINPPTVSRTDGQELRAEN
ncbi:MAG: multidrug effflux MFS transporter [Actinomycetia bacterium]|nr:multidrug effflux MFS transporter [Actinomycetes bacterium]